MLYEVITNAEEMAAKAKEKGIVVHTIGIGDPQGVPIPMGANGSFLKDNEGNVVVTKLDEETLKKVAAAGGGIYMRSANTSSGINALFNEIDKMQRADIESRVYSEYEEQFQWIAWIRNNFV